MKSSPPHHRVRAGAAMSLPSPTEGAIADLREYCFCPQQGSPDERQTQRPLDHGRPVAVRLPVLRRTSDAAHAAPGCAGGPRGPLRPRLCPVAVLRPVPRQLLYRTLLPVPRRNLERLSDSRRRVFSRRSSARPGRALCAGWQDPHHSGQRGYGAAGHRSGLTGRAQPDRMRLRALRTRRRPAPLCVDRQGAGL